MVVELKYSDLSSAMSSRSCKFCKWNHTTAEHKCKICKAVGLHGSYDCPKKDQPLKTKVRAEFKYINWCDRCDKCSAEFSEGFPDKGYVIKTVTKMVVLSLHDVKNDGNIHNPITFTDEVIQCENWDENFYGYDTGQVTSARIVDKEGNYLNINDMKRYLKSGCI